MTRTRRPSPLLVAYAAFLLAACSGEDQGTLTEPDTHAVYRVELTYSMAPDPSAALLTLPAAEVQTLEAVEGQIYSLPVGDEVHVMLLRAQPGPMSFRIHLSTSLPTPDVQLLQVSDPANRLVPPSTYHVAVTG
ncbi:MAG: hypothetical protein PVJ02_15540, partial [Gemmatimonadota bacterium]